MSRKLKRKSTGCYLMWTAGSAQNSSYCATWSLFISLNSKGKPSWDSPNAAERHLHWYRKKFTSSKQESFVRGVKECTMGMLERRCSATKTSNTRDHYSSILAICCSTDREKYCGRRGLTSERCLKQQTARSYYTRQGQCNWRVICLRKHTIIRCKLCSTCAY